MATLNPFTPGNSKTVTANTSSAASALPTGSGYQAWVYNAGSVAVFFAFGDSTVTAATDGTSPVLPPGVQKVITIPGSATYLATITASSTAAFYLTRGDGF